MHFQIEDQKCQGHNAKPYEPISTFVFGQMELKL